jgi:thiol-disulfide isomerase/thioredoxin
MNIFPLKPFVLIALLLGWVATASAALKVGDALPELSGFGLEGKLPDSLKGNVVMVDFWASWCGPCKESFPTMNELQKKYGDKGLVIIAINEDENKYKMEDFLKDHPVTFTVVRDAQQKLVAAAAIQSMPSSFVLDDTGRKLAKIMSNKSNPCSGNKAMRSFLHKIPWLAALAVAAGTQTGCGTVEPWQRGTLSDYTMRADRDPMGDDIAEHIFFSREMASGGKGVGGGGCGCN